MNRCARPVSVCFVQRKSHCEQQIPEESVVPLSRSKKVSDLLYPLTPRRSPRLLTSRGLLTLPILPILQIGLPLKKILMEVGEPLCRRERRGHVGQIFPVHQVSDNRLPEALLGSGRDFPPLRSKFKVGANQQRVGSANHLGCRIEIGNESWHQIRRDPPAPVSGPRHVFASIEVRLVKHFFVLR